MDSESREFSQFNKGFARFGRHAGAVVGGAALAVVVLAPAAASFHGLVGFGGDMLALRGGWEYVVPATLDGAALYAAALSLRAVLSGESAGGARFLVALYALGSAGFNAWHALYAIHASGGVPAALYFAAMSLSAVVLWEATLRQFRRHQLRESGALPAELPRFRLLRWLLAPKETPRVWRYAVLNEISEPSRAVRAWRVSAGRAETAAIEQSSSSELEEAQADSASEGGNSDGVDDEQWGRVSAETGHVAGGWGADLVRDQGSNDGGEYGEHAGHEVPGRGRGSEPVLQGAVRLDSSDKQSVVEPDPRLAGLTRADALRWAFHELDSDDVPTALTWLAERGVDMDRSHAYDVRRRLHRSRANNNGAVVELHRADGSVAGERGESA